jgi:small-conductance mechanosensitive channel
VKAAYNWELESSLARHGLEIPFPQRDLHVRSVLGLQDDQAWTALGRKAPRASETGDRTPASRAGGNDATEDVEREIAESPPRPASDD